MTTRRDGRDDAPGERRGGPDSPAPQRGLFDSSPAGGSPGAPVPGEPQPAAGSRSRPLSIAELNRSVQTVIETAHPALWVVGEISNLSKYSSGHLYFTLKDGGSEISAVMFAGSNRRLRFKPVDGSEVLAHGHPTLGCRAGATSSSSRRWSRGAADRCSRRSRP